ncbi:MAG: hypothetical protein ACK56F_12395, partial [bacterium]
VRLIHGAIVHFSTAGMTTPRNESLREVLRNDCRGPSGLGIEAWKCAKSGRSVFSALILSTKLLVLRGSNP